MKEVKWKEHEYTKKTKDKGRYKHATCNLKDEYLLLFGGANGDLDGENRLGEGKVLLLPSKNSTRSLFKREYLIPHENESNKEISEIQGWCTLRTNPKVIPSFVGHSLIYRAKNQEVALFGGEDVGYNLSNKLWILDLKRRNWRQVDMDLMRPGNGGENYAIPEPVSSHSAVYSPKTDSMLVFGGNNQMTVNNFLWEYKFTTNTWSLIESSTRTQPQPRCGHSAVVTNDGNHMVVFGGSNTKALFNDVWLYDIKRKSWEQLNTSFEMMDDMPDPISNHSCCIVDNFMYVYTQNQLHCLNINQLVWSRVIMKSTSAPDPNLEEEVIPERISATLDFFDDHLLLLDGFQNSGVLNDAYVIELAHETEVQGEKLYPLVSLKKKPSFSPSNFIDDSPRSGFTDSSFVETSTQTLLSKHLTDKVFNALRGRKTASGYGLDIVINSGVQNPSSKIGVFAPSIDAYEVFGDLFNPIVKDYHHGFMIDTQVHPMSSQLSAVSVDLKSLTEEKYSGYVMHSEIVVHRNLESFALPPAISIQQRKIVHDKIVSAFNVLIDDPRTIGEYYKYEKMDDLKRNELRKLGAYFDRSNLLLEAAGVHRDWPKSRGIYQAKNNTFFAWVNYEDSLHLCSKMKGFDIKTVYDILAQSLNKLATRLEFAYTNGVGYVTSSPANIGTGLLPSFHVKIPHASSSTKFDEFCRDHSLEYESLTESVYKISSSKRIGITETASIQLLIDGTIELIDWELHLEKEYALRHSPARTPKKPISNTESPSSPPPRSILASQSGFFEEDSPMKEKTPEKEIVHSVPLIDSPPTVEETQPVSPVKPTYNPTHTKPANHNMDTESNENELFQTYLLSCGELSIRPNTMIKHQLRTSTFCVNGTVDLSTNILSDMGIISLLPVFVKLPEMKRLDVSHNGLRNKGCVALCNQLRSHPGLSAINISYNNISLSAADAVLQLVRTNPQVTSVNLTNTRIEIKNKLRINTFIQKNKELALSQ